MISSKVLKELQQLKKDWRHQNFHYTTEQKKKYDELMTQRRDIIRNWYANDKVWVGPSNLKQTTKEEKKDDKKD